MSSFTNTSNLDNLLLQTLMGRLQIRPPNPLQPQLSPLFNQTLEDLLLDSMNNISDTEDDQDDDDDDENNRRSKTQLAKEESKLEKAVIKIILSGNGDETLKPNSGQAVTIGEHHICVGYHVETGSEYRVWEWHGHIMLFDDENGYNPEYIYGNYFERMKIVPGKMKEEAAAAVNGGVGDKEEKSINSGLKELIGSSEDAGSGRILHRNVNVGSSSLDKRSA
ncbi:unnamed protein product [Lactuca virosa]|uniref:Uncharacterized protein n=1 Tax=Lactuca virosa TaxID=75947 RepID=A0AAU9PP58_9ASTR|nr:unnamed protein product [Lactuca virosa]